jgi:hypothetical protein
MLPLIPKSVKMEPEVSVRLKDRASRIGYSENQLIVESVKGTLDLADDPTNSLPRLVVLIRSALQHEVDPQRAGQPPVSPKGMGRWWGL